MDNSKRTYDSQTKGGTIGYWWRRLIHVCIAVLPILYYQYGDQAAGLFGLSPIQFLLVIMAINVLVEGIRLFFGITLWGHREYERKKISALAWGIFSIGMVLIFAPGPLFAVPIIWGCAFVDPLLGELRRLRLSKSAVFFIGYLALLLIWWIATAWLGTPWWYAIIMAPIVLLAEWPSWKWVDDNALMQLVPLFFVLILQVV